MSIDDQINNHSGNRPFHDVLASRMNRRTMLAGSLATAATAFFASLSLPGRGFAQTLLVHVSVPRGGSGVRWVAT